MKSLLPHNATHLERQVEQLTSKSTTELPTENIENLKSSSSCSVDILPWVAWAHSVDEWNDEWSDEIKRSVIRTSFEVHRFKGTSHAIKTALSSLRIKTQLREWWEKGGSNRPGTITVLAFLTDNIAGGDSLINEESLEQVYRIVNATKRRSIHFEIELGMSSHAELNLYGGMTPPTTYLNHSGSEGLQPNPSAGDVIIYGGLKTTTILKFYGG